MQISPASTNPKLTDEGAPNIFRVCGRDDQQGAVAARYIVNNFKDKKIAILHDKTAYGKGLADSHQKLQWQNWVKSLICTKPLQLVKKTIQLSSPR